MRAFLLTVVAVLVVGCVYETIAPANTSYEFVQPDNFPSATYTFENNPLTPEGVELGRMLFYDPILSADSTIACANCHQQARGFSDPVHRFSRGVNDASGFRNAPAIQNVAFQTEFFWDGGVNHLDFVAINAITNPVEMQETLPSVLKKLRRSDRYSELFTRAFRSSPQSKSMLHAISQFLVLMTSANSRYDRYIRGEGEQFTADESEGLSLFQAKCATCHAGDLFTDQSFRNNGLDSEFLDDPGRKRITEFADDEGKFKVPSLRNAEVTFPYMHDGRFRTLEEVLTHYQNGVKLSATLDPLLVQGQARGVTMTEAQKEKIIAFIKTLTDTDYLTDPRFSNPF